MLIWTDRGRRAVVTVFAGLVLVLFVAPLLVMLVASLARTWNDVLPSSLTTAHLREALSADSLASLSTSIQTALIAGLVAVAVGAWAALATVRLPRRLRAVSDAFFHLPLAVPSVVVGFGVLVAFSRRPILLNGTKWIVIAAQAVLVLAFAHSTVSAALQRLDRRLLDVAASLGARPARVLTRVTLPLLLPSITAAAALAVALCMGELGATIMVYPSSWRTLPVTIFGLSDRGDVFGASAHTLVLLATTGLLLLAIGRVRTGHRRGR
ncbi:ABC transporter permease [Krasilnikovia sp. MM14-A1259]|uniref:ABC transporter permease n=1 Tax=Krasilnikovia sp. MM14-A1259 TaxID=3373539 RepID=UPI0038176600